MKKILCLSSILLLLLSCSTKRLLVKGVAYQSLAMVEENTVPNPSPLELSVECVVDNDGNVEVFVNNLSNSLMTIDRAKSFFMNRGKVAQMYYDPQVVVNTQSSTVGTNTAASVNLGAWTGSRALRGITVGGGSNQSLTNTETSYYVDQPKVSVPAHGRISMGRTFKMDGVGNEFIKHLLKNTREEVGGKYNASNTYAGATIYVYYSLDEEKTYHSMETTIYANSFYVARILKEGLVNDALRRIYTQNPTLFNEPWYLLSIPLFAEKNPGNNLPVTVEDYKVDCRYRNVKFIKSK